MKMKNESHLIDTFSAKILLTQWSFTASPTSWNSPTALWYTKSLRWVKDSDYPICVWCYWGRSAAPFGPREHFSDAAQMRRQTKGHSRQDLKQQSRGASESRISVQPANSAELELWKSRKCHTIRRAVVTPQPFHRCFGVSVACRRWERLKILNNVSRSVELGLSWAHKVRFGLDTSCYLIWQWEPVVGLMTQGSQKTPAFHSPSADHHRAQKPGDTGGWNHITRGHMILPGPPALSRVSERTDLDVSCRWGGVWSITIIKSPSSFWWSFQVLPSGFWTFIADVLVHLICWRVAAAMLHKCCVSPVHAVCFTTFLYFYTDGKKTSPKSLINVIFAHWSCIQQKV